MAVANFKLLSLNVRGLKDFLKQKIKQGCRCQQIYLKSQAGHLDSQSNGHLKWSAEDDSRIFRSAKFFDPAAAAGPLKRVAQPAAPPQLKPRR